MSSIEEVLRRTRTITFDCYGTLIDWRAGLSRSFGELFGPAAAGEGKDDLCPAQELLDAYVQIEAEVEAEGYQPYRRVLATADLRLARQFGLDLPTQRAGLLAEMLPQWPPFADTNEALARLKSAGYRLGVLSNIDRDLFAGTARQLDVAFDFVVTAEDVRAYKPAHAHFERLLAVHAQRDHVLHAAQSLFHDGAPAGELGIAYVWINRYKGRNNTEVSPLAEYADLASFAKVACGV